ncbi:MAG: PfkB family carbohydrate kinase [bacterium]
MKNIKNEILVIGSVVRDVTILPSGKKKEALGGTGTNIAFGLGVLGLYPYLVSVVGNDFNKKFQNFLNKNGIVLKLIRNNAGKMAAFSVKISKDERELWDWQANVANEIEKIKLSSIFKLHDLKNIKIVIFSPGTHKSVLKHMKEFNNQKSKNAILIFDPGQTIDTYTKKEFLECSKLANILILNEMEFNKAEKIIKKGLLKLFKNKIIIKTLGEKGSEIYNKGRMIYVPIIKAKKTVSTVGAGDAYRSGLIYGLLNNMSLEDSCKLGTKFSSRSVGKVGCHKSFFKI